VGEGALDSDVIVLVHGTFAADAAWTKPDHKFYKALQAKPNRAKIKTFVWSGENSHEARLVAADQLAQFVCALNLPLYARAHLIAHSHGGNVVLYALKEPAFRSRVGSLSFMGTPFLEVRERDISSGLRFFASAMGWLAIFPGLFFLMMLWGKVVYSLISWVAGDLFAFLISGLALFGISAYVGRWYVLDHRTRFGLVI
jgi:pimeloyl-ACP methyl ester carboxylesterase